MILPLLILSTILAGEDGPVAWAALVVSAIAVGWNILTQVKKNRPAVRLEIRNVSSPYFPEQGAPNINILCVRLSFGSDFASLEGPPDIQDNNGKSLSWSPPDPEDWNSSFDKKDSPVRIYFEGLTLESDSQTIQAVCRFDGVRFTIRSNKLQCDELLSSHVDGVRRKKPGEKEDDFLDLLEPKV